MEQVLAKLTELRPEVNWPKMVQTPEEALLRLENCLLQKRVAYLEMILLAHQGLNPNLGRLIRGEDPK